MSTAVQTAWEKNVAHRPAAWEEDISRNSLDTAPFANSPAIANFSTDEFRNLDRFFEGGYLAPSDLPTYVARDPYPIPGSKDREGYMLGRDVHYWCSGLSDCLKLTAASARHGVTIRRCFDFGCASGRVLRHLCAQTEIPEIWGSDINQRHVRWIYEHLPNRVTPIHNHTLPALPCEDNYFDLVCAFSVFTHIDVFETAWLAELRRILRPNGLAYLTVSNDDSWNALPGQLNNPDHRAIKVIKRLDPEYEQTISKPLPPTRTVYRFTESGPYRAHVFHSQVYLERVWSRFFDILEVLPMHHGKQAVVIGRKVLKDH